jgi:hypothetical protein
MHTLRHIFTIGKTPLRDYPDPPFPHFPGPLRPASLRTRQPANLLTRSLAPFALQRVRR